jgi:hypothetical protein
MEDPRQPKEAEIQRTILDWLAAKRIFHYRQNTGAVRAEDRFFRFGTPGSPDIVAVIGGRYIGIEVKAPRGVQSPAQREFEGRLRTAGGVYVLARSLEDVERSIAALPEPAQNAA